MYTCFRFRLYPTKSQADKINVIFDCVRFLYNKMLEERIYGHSPAKNFLSTSQYKILYPWLKEVDSYALSNTWLQLKRNLNRYYENGCGFPHFRSKKKNHFSYTTNNNPQKNNIRFENNHVRLPKIGFVKVIIHRPIPDSYTIKHVTVCKTRTNKYFVSVTFEHKTIISERQLNPNSTLGLDYSSPHFYVDSQGNKANMPNYYSELAVKIAKEQRKLSHMKKGGRNYNKERIRIAKLYEQLANKKNDWHHKKTSQLAKEWDYICVEDLSLNSFIKNRQLSTPTRRNSFGFFTKLLDYKMQNQGKKLIVANKLFPSSKLCSSCGFIFSELTINDRKWQCPQCHKMHDRDINAAINLANYIKQPQGLRG